ncbi:MAG TPA: BMC domain-containing protein [Candidatus Marinimicrobia bacterium]|nr:BMC domain-containing protein [Candidatus Neomarinimicrobiota bacterium]
MHAVGLVEMSSIARGFFVADTMLKKAQVKLLMNRSICPGKYMALIGGDVAEVEAAIAAGEKAADEYTIDTMIIRNLHSEILPALSGTNEFHKVDALGIVETFSVATTIEAADASLKAANVKIIQIHLAMAIGGKAYYSIAGDVAAVEAAVDAGVHYIKNKGLLVEKVVIPHPRQEIILDKI